MNINRAKLGKILIGLGVSVWGVYGVLLLFGQRPSLFLFLPIHLTFVLSGVRLRKLSGEDERNSGKNPNLKMASNIFLIIGMAAWLPYFYVHYYYQLEVGHLPFLVLHLTGMLGGGVTKLISSVSP